MVCFFEFLTPFILWGHNFFIFYLFSAIVNVLNATRRRIQVLFGHHKPWSPPLDLAYPKRLIVQPLANLPYCHPLSLCSHCYHMRSWQRKKEIVHMQKKDWSKMEGGRSEFCPQCIHLPSLLCVKSNTYLNHHYVAKIYFGYLETNVTFFASIKEWPFWPSYVMLC